MMKRLQRIDVRLRQIKSSIEKLPPGKLIYSKTGKYIKSYQKNGKEKIYIKKKEQNMAERLALKKYYQFLEKELSNEKQAIMMYLKQSNSKTDMVELFLSQNSEFKSLLDKQFKPRSKELEEWMNASYEKNPYHLENLIHKSISGNCVRSKSEALIDMVLYTNKIPYRYEDALQCGSSIIYPDFTIRHPKTGEFYYWEHFGMMDNGKYIENVVSKLRMYLTNGIIPTMQLIMTFETKEKPFTSEEAAEIVEKYFM